MSLTGLQCETCIDQRHRSSDRREEHSSIAQKCLQATPQLVSRGRADSRVLVSYSMLAGTCYCRCFSVAFHVYLSNAKVSPMVPAQRGKLMIHSSRDARLGNSGDSRRGGEDEQPSNARRPHCRRGRRWLHLRLYQGHVCMIEGGFSGVCRIGVGGRAHSPFVADSQRPMMSLDWTDTPAEFTRQTPVRGKMTLKSGVRREILWR